MLTENSVGTIALQGRCTLCSETNCGPGRFAFEEMNQDSQHHLLEDGDRLVIFPKEAGEPGADIPLWSGRIALMSPSSLGHTVYNLESDQMGEDAYEWLGYFLHEHPATLILQLKVSI